MHSLSVASTTWARRAAAGMGVTLVAMLVALGPCLGRAVRLGQGMGLNSSTPR
jgi:hypothetical protein